MKTRFLTHASLFVLLGIAPAPAADGEQIYEGTVTGIVCSACRAHVTTALKDNLAGTIDVRIVPSDDAAQQTITIVSTNEAVTKDTVITALGELKETYQILTLATQP